MKMNSEMLHHCVVFFPDAPKNTSLSVPPSTEFDTDSNITLTCSSYANPQVENYTWFKIEDGDTSVVSYGFELELHFWDVSPSGDLQYFCSATNKHGSQNSSTLRVDIRALPGKLVNMLIFISPLVSFSD